MRTTDVHVNCVRIRPGLCAQLQGEVVCVQVNGTHGVDESLSDRQRPAMQDSQRSLLSDLQILNTQRKSSGRLFSCVPLKHIRELRKTLMFPRNSRSVSSMAF